MDKSIIKLVSVVVTLLLVTASIGSVVAVSPGTAESPGDESTSGTQLSNSLSLRVQATDGLESSNLPGNPKRQDRLLSDLNATRESYIDANRTTTSPFETDRRVVAQTRQHAPSVAEQLVASDGLLAKTAIADAKRARNELEARNLAFDTAGVETNIEDAEKALREADGLREKSPVAAIEKYRQAWLAAQKALDSMDAAVTPQVTITLRLDPPHDESFEYPVRGTVFDVRPYEIENVTVQHAGTTLTVPLNASTTPATEATFDGGVSISTGVNEISVEAADPQIAIATKNERKERSAESVVGSDTLLLDGDALTDSYERTTLGSDPANPDSDADATPANEAGNGTVDGREDHDSDSLPTYQEVYQYGTDPLEADTDGDGLTDAYEIRTRAVNATVADTDGDSVVDGEADLDGDGLTGVEEQAANTSLALADTDDDGLSDSRELEIGTDPTDPDSDDDGISDGLEIELGTNPNASDSDGDGIPDGEDDQQRAITESETNATVTVTAAGKNVDSVSVRNATPNETQSFRKSPMIEIANRSSVEQATVTIPLDANAELSNTSNLAIYKWSPNSEQSWHRVGTEIDVDNRTATATVDSFSYFTVFNVGNWNTALTVESELSDTGTNESVEPIDLMFIADRSGSMSGSRLQNAKASAKRFVGALYERDQAGLVGYATSATVEQELTTDRQALNRSIDQLDAGGITNTGMGIRHSVDEFERNGIEGRPHIAILLSDGYTNTGPNPVEEARRAADNDITIYTIAIGSGANDDQLQEIASVTDGEFFKVRDASELPQVFDRIGEKTTDLKDSDGDGLPDVVEQQSLVLPSGPNAGKTFSLNPNAADTDGDGIDDGDEITVQYEVADGVLTTDVRSAIADPTDANSDGVGLDDGAELAKGSSPFVAERLILMAHFPSFAEKPEGASDEELELTTDFPLDAATAAGDTYRLAPTTDVFNPSKDKDDKNAVDDLFDAITGSVPGWMPDDYNYQSDKSYMRVPVRIKMLREGNANAGYELPSEYELSLSGFGDGKIIAGAGKTGQLELGEEKTYVVLEYTPGSADLTLAAWSPIGTPTVRAEIDEDSVFARDVDSQVGTDTVEMSGSTDRGYSINDAASYRLDNLLDSTESALSSSATIIGIVGGGTSALSVFIQTGRAGTAVFVFALEQVAPGPGAALDKAGSAGVSWVRAEAQDARNIDDSLDRDIVVVQAGPTVNRAA